MDDFERTLARHMKDPDFRKEWEAEEEKFRARLEALQIPAEERADRAAAYHCAAL